jgi:peptidoglycan/xylan/chitin deacetylase (PgdA/CDA1 family)
MLETYLAQGHADEYLDLCQGRIRGLTVFMTTRNLDGLAVPGLGAMLGELLDRARSRGIRIDVQSHGSTHVDFRSLALDEQVENISTSIGDLGDAGHSVEEFRPPSMFMNMDTYRACHILGIRGPVARNVPSDYHLMETANLPAEEGREFIRRECRKELGRGRDLVVLFHFERMQDERAPALLGEYLEVAESTGDG